MLGTINKDGQRFLDRLGEHHSSVFGDPREITFLYQRIAMLIQIFKLVALHGTFLAETMTED